MAFVGFASGAAGAADYPVNQRPMYGGVSKTPDMIAADQRFIDGVLKAGYTRASGSDRATEDGFSKFFRGDHAAAMRAFNQAWLLDPDNGSAYHGFALVLVDRDRDVAGAEAMFKRMVGARRNNDAGWTDYGRFLLISRRPREAVVVLKRAVAMADLEPNARPFLAMAHAESGDWPNACREAKAVTGNIQLVLKQQMATILDNPACAKIR